MTAFSESRVRMLASLRGEQRFALFDQVRERLYASPVQIKERQLQALRDILTHAYDSTRAYRARMDAAGLDPRKLETLGDLARLPVTTKRDMQDRPDEFVSSAVDPQHRHTHSTSGSTGTPFTFQVDNAYIQLGQAGTMRNMTVAGWRPGDALALVWGYETAVETPLKRLKSWFSQTYYLNAFRQDEPRMERWARLLKRKKIGFLYGYPSSLHLFAQFVLERSMDLPMQAVFCTAEKYFRFERESVEKAFRCRSYDLYGSSEVQNIAFECTRGKMHVSSDYVVLEDDARTSNQLPGLIVTSLHNRSMPFIRYDLGDYGRSLTEAKCDCGIHTPLVEVYGGSKYDFLLTPEGTVHGAVLERIFNKFSEVRQYQIVQHDVKRYTIRCAFGTGTDAGALRNGIEQAGRETLLSIMGEGVQIAFEYPAHIPPGRGGKYRFVYRET
ncbi:MAG: phenylacetate--CoA ligase family protein [Kiritimatiellae bacterium]|nr:phenylacetate--CoA ligase family protein [Kiritimatiellia bacterium]